MNTTEIAIVQGLADWLIAAGATSTKVLGAHQVDATKPVPPFLMVHVRLTDLPHGGDGIFFRDDDTAVGVGERSGAVTVHAHGDTAANWLEAAVSQLPLPTAQDLLTTAGLTVEPSGGLIDLTDILDEHPNRRWARDFDVLYQRVSGEQAFVDAATVATTQAIDDLTSSPSYDVS